MRMCRSMRCVAAAWAGAAFLAVAQIPVRAQPGPAQAQGQQSLSGANSETGPTATALPIREAPMIDGLLNESVWQEAPPLTGFTQSDPFEGEPASEPTEVRIAYDDDAIYVGVMLHDSDPSQIVTTDTRRDANLNEMDSFQI